MQLQLPINKEGEFLLLPARLDAAYVQILPDCSLLAASTELSPRFPYLQCSATVCLLLHDPRLPAEVTRQSSAGKASGSGKAEWWKGK